MVFLVLLIEEDFLIPVFLEVVADRHEEPGAAAGRIAGACNLRLFYKMTSVSKPLMNFTV